MIARIRRAAGCLLALADLMEVYRDVLTTCMDCGEQIHDDDCACTRPEGL